MKKILFPATNRVHLARQQRLLAELRKSFEVEVFEPTAKNEASDMNSYALACAVEFNAFVDGKVYDAALIRADRFELLPIASLCAYRGIPIVHIEGGCETGSKVIDSKVRHAITELADIHLVTDAQAKKKVIYLGAEPEDVHNVGSLDVSYAKSIVPERFINEPYILLLHHSVPGEETQLVYEALHMGYRIVGVKSNQDYQKSLMQEEYSPEEFISLMYFADCMVGNSSAICKEASILGTPCVLVGTRQDGRVVGRNVVRVPCDRVEITKAVRYQLEHGRYSPDEVYYKQNTEERIREILEVL